MDALVLLIDNDIKLKLTDTEYKELIEKVGELKNARVKLDALFFNIADIIEDVKLKLTDNEYKELIEMVGKLKKHHGLPPPQSPRPRPRRRILPLSFWMYSPMRIQVAIPEVELDPPHLRDSR